MHSHSHKIFSCSDRGIEACLYGCAVAWLSSAGKRTAEGFDSVHSRYPAPSGTDQNRRLSQHCRVSSTSCLSLPALGCSLYNIEMGCNILLNSQNCLFSFFLFLIAFFTVLPTNLRLKRLSE